MNHNSKLVSLKINPIITQAVAVQFFSVSFKLPKAIHIYRPHILRKTSKLSHDAQLKVLGHPGKLFGAQRIEYNLKRRHLNGAKWQRVRESNPSLGLERAVS